MISFEFHGVSQDSYRTVEKLLLLLQPTNLASTLGNSREKSVISLIFIGKLLPRRNRLISIYVKKYLVKSTEKPSFLYTF